MNFGQALEALKNGRRLARSGWNGKGMFVVYQKGYPDGIPCNKNTAEAWGMQEGELFKVEPYLQIRMVNGSHAMWVPSINDILAEDWDIVGVYSGLESINGGPLADVVNDIPETWQKRLREETLELAKRVNKLHDYMKTLAFYNLERPDKDLLYSQESSMMEYLQILGIRCEMHGITLF
jgi:hypothetical protein